MLRYAGISDLAASPRCVRIPIIQRTATTTRSFASRSEKSRRRTEAIIISPKPKSIAPQLDVSAPLQCQASCSPKDGTEQCAPPIIEPSQNSEVSQKKTPVIMNPRPRIRKVKLLVATPQEHVVKTAPRHQSPFIFDHMGFKWDLLEGSVSLSEAERLRCLRVLENCMDSIGESDSYQTQLQEAIGALLHASHIVMQGRSRLGLLTRAVVLQRQTTKILPPSFLKRIRKHLAWWADHLRRECDRVKVNTLQKRLPRKEIRIDIPPAQDIRIFVGEKRERLEWKSEGKPATHWMDVAVIEMAVRHSLRRPGVGGTRLKIVTSNAEAVDSWTMGASLNPLINELIFSTLHTLAQVGCWMSLEWEPPSQRNRKDATSRSPVSAPDPTRSVRVKPLQPALPAQATVYGLESRRRAISQDPKSMPSEAHRPTFRSLQNILDPGVNKLPPSFCCWAFQWDLISGTVCLTTKERNRCLHFVKLGMKSLDSLRGDHLHLKELAARMLHASHVLIKGRLHLESFLEALLCNGAAREVRSNDLQERLRADLAWWLDLLERRGDVTPISTLGEGVVDTKIYTDASLYACAIVMAGRQITWRWKDGVKLDPHFAEAVPAEIAVRLAVTEPGMQRSHLKMTSDSTTLITSWMMGRSNNPQINRVILSMAHVLIKNGCWLSFDWISSNSNPADAPSRSETGIGLEETRKWDPAVIPAETRQYLRD